MVSHAIGAIVRAGRAPDRAFVSANDLISKDELPTQYRQVLLQVLESNGLLLGDSLRDERYSLAVPLQNIPLLAIIEIIDGPVLRLGDLPASLRDEIGATLVAEMDVLSDALRKALGALTMDRFSNSGGHT